MKHVSDVFQLKFPNSLIPTQKTIQRIVTKFEKEGTMNNLPHLNRERHVLTPQKLAEVKAGLEQDSLQPMGHPSVNSEHRNSLCLCL